MAGSEKMWQIDTFEIVPSGTRMADVLAMARRLAVKRKKRIIFERTWKKDGRAASFELRQGLRVLAEGRVFLDGDLLRLRANNFGDPSALAKVREELVRLLLDPSVAID